MMGSRGASPAPSEVVAALELLTLLANPQAAKEQPRALDAATTALRARETEVAKREAALATERLLLAQTKAAFERAIAL